MILWVPSIPCYRLFKNFSLYYTHISHIYVILRHTSPHPTLSCL